ncbi:otefin [Drosophila rhopaloa]|uniref:Otefin n=1 Tax=Drosophila rhopaloa TaxID=1041015 RepID=A0A6P4FN37_DRORH|nr:otefin [Drosophila rhopaloa]
MADVDDFDSLSNAELRAKMLAQGLPNIPVTDSSRKVLVKRLRASIGGQASPAASPKKSSRRETLAPGPIPVASAPAAASTPVDKLDGNKVAPATKARRTIAATEAKEAERRRPEEPVVVRKPTAVAAPPIQTRRTSTSSTGFERKVVEPVKKPQPIAEEPASNKRADREEKYLKVNSLIVLESDEEEDEQLAQAANLVEQQHAAREKATSKLTSSGTTTYEYKSKVSSVVEPPRRPVYEPTPAPVEPPRRPVYEPTPAPVLAPSGPSARTQTQTSSARSYDYLNNPTGRYSSYVRTAAQGYVTAEAPPAPSYTSSNYRSTYANELSDENEGEDDQYESTFAQNLARLRAERIGDRSSPYSRRTLASGSTASGSLGYEPRARRSLRPDDNSISVAFGRWWNSLEQKYHIKSKLFILFVVVLLIGIYSIFF